MVKWNGYFDLFRADAIDGKRELADVPPTFSAGFAG